MAHYNVEHVCGHDQEIELFGKTSQRYEKIEWMARGLCPDCYREKKQQEREQENERAAKLSKSLGFSQLEGSEKQILWANSIRQKVYENICQSDTEHPVYGYTLVAEAISLETSAKWWIDHRSVDCLRITKIISANYPADWQAIQTRGKETLSNNSERKGE